MTMLTITHEQRQAVEQAGGQPVRLEDPENHRALCLAPGGQRISRIQPNRTILGKLSCSKFLKAFAVPMKAFLRDLPELLKDDALRGQRIAYHGDERIGIAPSEEPLIPECLRLGLRDDQYDFFVIEEIEKVTFPSSWL